MFKFYLSLSFSEFGPRAQRSTDRLGHNFQNCGNSISGQPNKLQHEEGACINDGVDRDRIKSKLFIEQITKININKDKINMN